MKWFIVFLVNIFSIAAFAQEQPFEGEIVYESFEHYSETIKKQFNSQFFDGVHKIRLILKGSKMHMIDETAKIHCVVDDALLSYTHFCEWTKSGFSCDKGTIDLQVPAFLAPRTLTFRTPFETFYFTLLSNTFAPKNVEKSFLDFPCKLYEGDVSRNITTSMSSMDMSFSVKAYVSNIPSPAGYKWGMWGLEIPGIALQWRMKMDFGHISSLGNNGGEHSLYIEADVVEIIPRNVSDEEFVIPSDYKIVSSSTSIVKYRKDVKKQLEKNGIKGGNTVDKTTGVHYQTDEEWDF